MSISDKPRFEKATPLSHHQLAIAVTPTATLAKAKWANNVFDNWRRWKSRAAGELIPPLDNLHDKLHETVAQFVREARKQDGTRYPANTLHELVTSLQKHLEIQDWG